MQNKFLLLAAFVTFPAWNATLTVRVIDYAQISEETLRKASAGAQALFRAAGIDTEWLTCAADRISACAAPSPHTELLVKILAPAMEDPAVSKHLLGTTHPATLTAFIFYSHVRVSSLARNDRGSELLALVMAHETGHLLGLEHSAGGIMRDSFRPMDIEKVAIHHLTFTGNQSAQARSAISARLAVR